MKIKFLVFSCFFLFVSKKSFCRQDDRNERKELSHGYLQMLLFDFLLGRSLRLLARERELDLIKVLKFGEFLGMWWLLGFVYWFYKKSADNQEL